MTPTENPPAKSYLRRLEAASRRFPKLVFPALLAGAGVGAYFLWDGIGSSDVAGQDIYVGVLALGFAALCYVSGNDPGSRSSVGR